MHPANNRQLPVSEIGLIRFSCLEKYARERNVHLCYENSQCTGHLLQTVKHADAFHGFCCDCGHHHCYDPQTDYLGQLGEKLMYTHLYDNHGQTRDKHLLPFDGSRDWEALAAGIGKTQYAGTLNLELSCIWGYNGMSYEEFSVEAMERAKKLRGLINGTAY